MRQYLDLLRRVLQDGDPQYNERTGQLMIVSAGDQSIYDLREGFPRCTTKASATLSWVGEELFWMLRGEHNAKTLYDRGPNIWNRNAYDKFLKNNALTIKKNTAEWEEGFKNYENKMKHDSHFNLRDSELGPVYGAQWRNFDGTFINHQVESALEEISNTIPLSLDLRENVKRKFSHKGVDQLTALINGIKKDKGSRYFMMTAWNPNELAYMALGPCHCLVQCTVTRNRDLDVNMYQRSCDVFLGVPFNIMQYSLFNHLIAKETGLEARKFIHSYGNVHIYGGVSPRTDFLNEDKNLEELQNKVRGARGPEDFLAVREWYLSNAPAEEAHNERKDHIPFVLEQLSKTPGLLPKLQIQDLPFFELIKQRAREIISLEGGDKPQNWDSRAVMAV